MGIRSIQFVRLDSILTFVVLQQVSVSDYHKNIRQTSPCDLYNKRNIDVLNK